jgi:hypothetical protein
MFLGAAVWLAAWMFPAFAYSAASRIFVSSLIVASYTFLIAVELWRERRKSLATCSAVSPAAGLRFS